MSEATVFHVDDDPLVRRGLEMLLASVQTAYQGYPSAQSFLEAFPKDQPGCLVTDLRMPGLGGMELLHHVAARGLQMPVIIFSGHAEVGLAVAALKAGAVDFLEKPAGNQTLLGAIQRALALDARRRQDRARHEVTAARLHTLASGEREVLDLMVRGKGYKAIAADLGVSYKTVEARRARLMQKMECETLAELLAGVISWQLWADANRAHGPRASL